MRKFVIVYYEKVVRIPLEGDEILQVHRERTLGATKALMNDKVDEPRISDIPVVCNFIDVFSEDLSMTTAAQVEFRIDLVPGATPLQLNEDAIPKAAFPERDKDILILRYAFWLNHAPRLVFGVTRKEKLYLSFLSVSFGLERRAFSGHVSTDNGNHTVHPMGDALSRKEIVKSRRVRGMILAAQSEAFKLENVLTERLHGLEQQMETKGDESFVLVRSNMGSIGKGSVMVLRPCIKPRVEKDIATYVSNYAAESVRDAIGFEYCLASSSGWTKVKLVQETTDKVVLVKEKPKAVRDCQKSYVDFRRKPLEFELGDRVLLKVTPWKGVVRFGKKGKLASRYVGPFEILERIGPVAYRLRLSEELSGVHDTFHVSNLKKCLADASLHVPLDEIKVDKTLRFVEEPVEIMDREIKSLKHSKISLVKRLVLNLGMRIPKGGYRDNRGLDRKGLKRQKEAKTVKNRQRTKETRTRVKKQPEIKSRINPTQQE
ncbi:hypothetical protein Tco_0411578 [Tanacetum coccineum]